MRPYEYVDNPLLIEQRTLYYDRIRELKPFITCCCGCRRELVEGWRWEGDFFFEDDCVLRFMKEYVLQPYHNPG